MSEYLIRVYQRFDVKKVKEQLLICGDLSGQCANCNEINIKLETAQCPQCQATFNYLSFRNIKSHMAKILRLIQDRPNVVLIDFEDYQRIIGAMKAGEFLK